MMLLAARPWLGTTLTVAAALLVTAQAFNAPAKPRKARDLVSITDAMQGPLTDICRMYPGDCQYSADGSVTRVAGRRIMPGTDRTVLRHFQTEIGTIQDASWGQQ